MNAPVATEKGKKEVENTMKDAENDATSKIIIPEVRFTSKGNDLYAYVCSFKGKKVLIKTLSAVANLPIKSISLIGSGNIVKWKQTNEGLIIDMPTPAINEVPIVGFRIKFQNS